MLIHGQALVHGTASGEILYSSVALSFWGGVDTATGEIVDYHHPLAGQRLRGRVLAIPCGRGSCSGSVALLEILLNSTGPAALVFQLPEQILTLGVIVAQMLFDTRIPVLLLKGRDFEQLGTQKYTSIQGEQLYTSESQSPPFLDRPLQLQLQLPVDPEPVYPLNKNQLDIIGPEEELLLSGKKGKAAQVAARILLEFARIQNAPKLIPVSQAHIDACVYTGPASIRFAEYFLDQKDAQTAVPTSMNSIAIDKRRWHEIGIDPVTAREAERLADAYVAMGAKPTFTCAPYLLSTAPTAGQDIGWGESNAVVFANSVLGARTQKYPDFVDVCIALTGRAPSAGCHVQELRVPTLTVVVPELAWFDDSLYPLLGYCIGHLCGPEVPFICAGAGAGGLQNNVVPRVSDLKAFSAAFATTSSAAMFHLQGITPEASQHEELKDRLRQVHVTCTDLRRCWQELNTAQDDTAVSLVALGNPHFAFDEFIDLAVLCSGRRKAANTSLIITTSQEVYSAVAAAAGGGDVFDILDRFGAQVITDTCWCMIREPQIAPGGGNIMTNSAKYAHYAPGLVQRKIHFGALEDCVQAACEGNRVVGPPPWLTSLS